jgi:hypothetical protein
MFLAASDCCVPIATGLALKESMGSPETYILSGGHITSSLCFGFLLRRSEEFLLGG